MSCQHIKQFLDAHVDGELEANTMLKIENHLDNCETCKALWILQRDLKQELAIIGSNYKAPLHLKHSIKTISKKRNQRIWITATIAAPIAAAATFLIIFASYGSPIQETNLQISAVVSDVVKRHIRKLPMEVRSNDPQEATSWFQGKVDFPVSAPSAKLKNASFQGARVSNIREEQAAQMVYMVDGHRVTLMIFPSNKIAISGGKKIIVNGHKVLTGTSTKNGYNVVFITKNGMVYALSSDLPTSKLVSLLADKSI